MAGIKRTSVLQQYNFDYDNFNKEMEGVYQICDEIERRNLLKLLFVVGNPGETWEDVEDDVKLALKYPLQDVHFYNIIPYPGTEPFAWVNRRFVDGQR